MSVHWEVHERLFDFIFQSVCVCCLLEASGSRMCAQQPETNK